MHQRVRKQASTQAVKARAMQPRTRRDCKLFRVDQDRPRHHQYRYARNWLALHCQCHVAEIAALDGVSARRWLDRSSGTQAEKAWAIQPCSRLGTIGSGLARTVPATRTNDLYTICSRSIASAMLVAELAILSHIYAAYVLSSVGLSAFCTV